MSEIMTTEEVAEYLRTSVESIKRMARQGDMPAAKVGRNWRFRKGDIDGISKCLTVKERPKFSKQFEGKSEKEIEDLKKQFRELSAKITNTVLEKKQVSETEIHLKVKTEFFTDKEKKQKEGEETKWKIFKLENGAWKIENP